MLIQTTRSPAVSADGRDIDSVLLADAQAYLEARRQGKDHNSRLTEAWEKFYLACTPQIERIIAGYPMSEDARCDCVQDVWTEIIARLRQFRYDPHQGRLRTWLHALARNKAVDVIRRLRRHPSEILGDTLEKSLPGQEPDPAAECERKEIQAMIRDALCRLYRASSKSGYQVLYLRWIEDRTVPEIAVALGLTPEQVHYRHHRVMRKFRRFVEESYRSTPSR